MTLSASAKLAKEMDVGERGYTVPWALSFDLENKPYLHIEYTVVPLPECTSVMPIRRTGPGLGDYEVVMGFSWAGRAYEWEQKEDPRHSYFARDPSVVVPIEKAVVASESASIYALDFCDNSDLDKKCGSLDVLLRGLFGQI